MTQFEVPDLWVILRIRVEFDDHIVINLEDHTGRQMTARSQVLGLSHSSTLTPTINVDSEVFDVIENFVGPLTAELPLRHEAEYYESTIPPLPVFVEPPSTLAAMDWESAFEASLAPLDAGELSFVRLAGRIRESRTPFRLPMRILGVGSMGGRAVSAIKSEWYLNDSTVQRHGFIIDEITDDELTVALKEEQHLILSGPDRFSQIVRLAGRLPQTQRPRLIVVLDEGRGPISSLLAWASAVSIAPSSTAVLWLSAPDWVPLKFFLPQFIRCLVHDYPIHEAAKVAESQSAPAPAIRVAANPASIQSLRMIDAYEGVVENVSRLESDPSPGDVVGFLNRAGTDATPGLREALLSADSAARAFKEASEAIRSLPLTFEREGFGLKPLSNIGAQVERAMVERPSVIAGLTRIAENPEMVETVRKHQQRKVDVALQRTAYSPLAGPRRKEPMGLLVNRNTVLRRTTSYLLQIRIGRPFARSVISGEVPPLDPLLPPSEPGQGHEIDVVVFGMDFQTRAKNVQTAFLPPLGGTEPLSFEVTTPEVVGRARLRIALYHKDHLLQMLRLDALVDAEERVEEKEVLSVRMEMSRTSAFANLDGLGKRLFSAGVNDDGDGRTHTFVFKRGGTARDVRLPESMLQKHIDKFRDILIKASVKYDEANNPVSAFDTYPSPAQTAPSPEFHAVIRDLARLGRDLRVVVWRRAGIKADLKVVGESADQIIQVVRATPNYVFPWSILYDFEVPPEISGRESEKVCLGVNCNHGPSDKAFCLNGFWGVRHYLEELIAHDGAAGRNAVKNVTKPTDALPVRLVLDRDVPDMQAALAASIPEAFSELSSGEDLYELLWMETTRPAVLIVLGHLEIGEKDQQPVDPRIFERSSGKWLTARQLTDKAMSQGEWNQPRSLVLVMACGSGKTDLDTLNDFVLAFNDAGAGAVVGTECVVVSDLAQRFSGDVIASMSGDMTLGAAVTTFRRRLLREGNPLAFVFNVIGDAELEVKV